MGCGCRRRFLLETLTFPLTKQQGSLYNYAMMEKQKAPPVATNNRQGYQTHAIAHMGLDNFIVSLSRTKGKAHNDMSQLQNRMQEVWEKPERESAFPLLEMRQDLFGRQAVREHVSAHGESNRRATTAFRGLLHSEHGENHWRQSKHDS